MSALAQRYQISAMPTFVCIRNGKEVSRCQGANIQQVMNQINTLSANIESVEQNKQRGNLAFSNDKDCNTALNYYQTALTQLQSIEDYLVKHKELYMKLHTNIALMYLKIGGHDNYNSCIRHCNEVLKKEIDPYNEKAFLRKGEALMQLKQYETAKKSYALYMKYDPDNQEMKAKWTEAKNKAKQQNSAENKL
mmetsp:Transcript_74260/g.118273  ORF Transcript_74260/g.118273 Transcript_74260/m.118273 type:complete len:193 (+) Transcript_74260:2-580(+)